VIHGCKNLDKVRACAEIDDCDDWMMVMMASVKACDDVRLLLGLARIVYVCIWCIYNFLAGTSPKIWSYAVYTYGSGQP
jgi:hypothetical protein